MKVLQRSRRDVRTLETCWLSSGLFCKQVSRREDALVACSAVAAVVAPSLHAQVSTDGLLVLIVKSHLAQ